MEPRNIIMSTKPTEIQQRSNAVITDPKQFKEYVGSCRRPGIPLRLMNVVDRPRGWETMDPNTVIFPKLVATTPPPAVAPAVAPVATRAPFQTPPPKAKSPVESPNRYNQSKQFHPVGSPYHPDNVRWNLEQIELQKAKASSLKAPPSPPKIETAQDVVEAMKEIPPFEIFANEVAKMDAEDEIEEDASFDERDALPKETPDIEFVGTKESTEPEVVFLETRRPVNINITGDGRTVVRSTATLDDDSIPPAPTDFDDGHFVIPQQFVVYYMRLRHYRVERNMMMNKSTNMKRNGGGWKRMAFQRYMRILTKIESYLNTAHVFIRQYNREHAHEPEHSLIVTMMSNLLHEFQMKHVTGPVVPSY